MRKIEHIYLHALFAEIRRTLEESGTVPSDAFTAYDANDVDPAAIHCRKSDHKEALDLLADGVLATVEANQQTDSTQRTRAADSDSIPTY